MPPGAVVAPREHPPGDVPKRGWGSAAPGPWRHLRCNRSAGNNSRTMPNPSGRARGAHAARLAASQKRSFCHAIKANPMSNANGNSVISPNEWRNSKGCPSVKKSASTGHSAALSGGDSPAHPSARDCHQHADDANGRPPADPRRAGVEHRHHRPIPDVDKILRIGECIRGRKKMHAGVGRDKPLQAVYHNRATSAAKTPIATAAGATSSRAGAASVNDGAAGCSTCIGSLSGEARPNSSRCRYYGARVERQERGDIEISVVSGVPRTRTFFGTRPPVSRGHVFGRLGDIQPAANKRCQNDAPFSREGHGIRRPCVNQVQIQIAD